MRIYIVDCGGAVGPPLIRWILEHSDAVIAGSDSRHERLEDLLGVPRFNFYVMEASADPPTAQEFVRSADLVIDLRALERPAPIEDMEALTGALEADWLPGVSAAAGTRLVYVSSDRVYDRSPGPMSPTGDVAGVLAPQSVSAQLTEDDAPLLPGRTDDAAAALGRIHDAIAQQLIYASGRLESLDFTIVRVFDALGDSLEWVGAPGSGLPARVHRALHARTNGEIPASASDRVVRAFVHVNDVAEGIGLVATDVTGRSSGIAINLGAPENLVSAVQLAEMELEGYREGVWDGNVPLPRIVEGDLEEASSIPVPSIERARRLLGWEPQVTVRDSVEAALRALRTDS